MKCPLTLSEELFDRVGDSLSRENTFKLCGNVTQPPVHCCCFSVCVCVGVYERMKVDQRKFGKSSWTAAVERMERLRYSVAKETLQLQRAREICLEQRKHTLRDEVTQRTEHTCKDVNKHTLTVVLCDFFRPVPSDAESVQQ